MIGKLKSDVGIVQAEPRRVEEGVTEVAWTMRIHDNPGLASLEQSAGCVIWRRWRN
jgi:hypothetical protein